MIRIRKDTKRLSLLLCIATSLSLSACGSKIVCKHLDRNSASDTGIVYYLPKTLVTARVAFGIYKAGTEYSCRLAPIDNSGTSKSIELTTATVADPDYAFLIDTEKLNSPAVETGKSSKSEKPSPLTISLTPQGTLRIIKTEFSDKTANIFANLEKGAEKFLESGIRLAAMSGDSTVPEEKLVGTLPLSKQFEPSNGKIEFTETWVKKRVTDFAQKCGAGQISVPEVNILFDMPSARLQPSTSKSVINGLVLRNPVSVMTRVEVDSGLGNVLETVCSIPVCQAGDVTVVPMDSLLLSNRTHEVQFSDNGTVTSYDISSTSSAHALFAQLRACSQSILTLFQNTLPAIDVKAKTEVMQSKLASLTAKRKQLEAEKALKAAKEKL